MNLPEQRAGTFVRVVWKEVTTVEATKRNYHIALQIIELLANENCTVKQSEEILSFVGTTIRITSTVQRSEFLTELLNRSEEL